MNLKNFKKSDSLNDDRTTIKFNQGRKPSQQPIINKSVSNFVQSPSIEITLDKNLAKSTNTKSSFQRRSANTKEKKRWPMWKRVVSFFLIILVLAGVGGGYLYWSKLQDLKNTGVENVGFFDPLMFINDAAGDSKKDALSDLEQTDGRTNVLTIGIDARSAGDSLLTDSMIVMSYDHATNRVVQFSMPRDFLAPYNNRYDKLNSVFPYSYSAARQTGKNDADATKQGIKDLSDTIEKVTGLKIHYGVLINFRGFKDLIDQIGGVTIDVENSFTDYEYPNDNDTGLITVSFKAGVQDMKGTRALQYARSRHSVDNNEGTDFARARRQQKVINAIRDKVLSSDALTQIDSFNKILTILGQNIKLFNIKTDDISKVIQAKDLIKLTVSSGFVVDTSIGSYPEQVIKGGMNGKCYGLDAYYACAVKGMGDYTEIKSIINFNLQNPDFVVENADMELIWTNGKRYNDYDKLRDLILKEKLPFVYYEGNIRVTSVSPTPTDAQQYFVTIYTKADSAKPKTIEAYKKLLEKNSMTYIEKSSTDAPKELTNIFKSNDILLVIE